MKWKPEQVTEWKLLVDNDLLFSHNALCIFACLSFRRRYTIFLVSCSKNMHARTHTHMYVCTHACTHAHTYTSKNTHGGVKLLPSPSCITTHTHTHKRGWGYWSSTLTELQITTPWLTFHAYSLLGEQGLQYGGRQIQAVSGHLRMWIQVLLAVSQLCLLIPTVHYDQYLNKIYNFIKKKIKLF